VRTPALLLAAALWAGAPDGGSARPVGLGPGAHPYPTAAFAPDGRLLVAFTRDGFVYVAASDDLGASFGPAVAVNREPEPVDANGEGRPKLAAGAGGAVFVSWTRKLERPFTGLVRFSRSGDGGKTFSEPVTLNDDGLETGHRFDTLAVSPTGDVLVAWIDKRDLERAQAEGREYAGAAIYTALSRDGGRSFEPNRKLDDHVCECCRLSIAFDPEGRAVVFYRDLLPGGIRDHSLAWGAGEPGAPTVRRVTVDEWRLDGCPHHGPSLWIDASGAHHIVWFTAGEARGPGLFYARQGEGEPEAPVTFGDSRRGASHPDVLGVGPKLYRAWRELDGERHAALLQDSTDGGRSWSAPRILARGRGGDHPLLVSDGREVFLSWYTEETGYRLVSAAVPEETGAGAAR